LIHGHYAKLIEDDAFDLYLLNDGLKKLVNGCYEKWVVRTVFPSPEKDLLMHLCLLGNVSFQNVFSYQSVTTKAVVESCLYSREFRESVIDFENSNQRTNDGMLYEALLACAMCLSSHLGGLEGIPVHQFLKKTYEHLNLPYLKDPNDVMFSLDDLDRNEATCSSVGKIPIMNILRRKVPFLSPPNTKWPEKLASFSEFNLCNLTRSKNSERIDLCTELSATLEGTLTGECKDHGRPIGKSVMEEILKRVPAQSVLHLVFTNSIVRSFREKSEISNKELLKNRIVLQMKGNFLHSIAGLEETRHEFVQLVIFMAVFPNDIGQTKRTIKAVE